MKRIVFILFFIIASLAVSAQSESMSILLRNTSTRQANIGVYMVNLSTGQPIDSFRPDNLIPPASVMKLLTTATALETYGENYCFPTVLEYSGSIVNGVLLGNLYIHGYGDPVLGSQSQSFLSAWVRAVQDAGIREIQGSVIGDASYFEGDEFNPGWLYEDLGTTYAQGVYALAYMDNATPDPPLTIAQHFTTRLRQMGVKVGREAASMLRTDGTHRTAFYTHFSEPLSLIIERTNMFSINLYAETIYRTLGAKLAVPCTLSHSETYVRRFWHDRGLDLSTTIIKDGCGLAPQNGVSARTWVELLRYMSNSTNIPAYLASLPVSGRSGTLKNLLADTELEGRVHAKSGTIAGTRNYAGYVYLPNGQRWAFAVLVNSAPCKAKEIQPVIAQYLLDVYRRNL